MYPDNSDMPDNSVSDNSDIKIMLKQCEANIFRD